MYLTTELQISEKKIDRSNEKKDEPTIIVGDLNALLSATDRTSIQTIIKNALDQNNVVNNLT